MKIKVQLPTFCPECGEIHKIVSDLSQYYKNQK